MQRQEGKKQFSLTVILRVFLVLIVVVSIVVFANSVMKYNAMVEEQKELEELLEDLNEDIEELEELLGSGEEVQKLLNDYQAYQAMIDSNNEIGYTLEEIQEKRERLKQMIESSENKDYIVRIAKDRLGLYFPDEEIFYNDKNRMLSLTEPSTGQNIYLHSRRVLEISFYLTLKSGSAI